MSLEQSIACEELDKNASDTPNIAREAPTQIQDNLWGSVVPGGDDRGVILVVKSGRSKVNESDLGIKQDPPEFGRSGCGRRRRGDIPVVGESLI